MRNPDAYDFRGLTVAQEWLLTYCGWSHYDSPRRPMPKRTTVEPLITRGLMSERKSVTGDTLAYEVPISVHAAWCAHCAAKGE